MRDSARDGDEKPLGGCGFPASWDDLYQVVGELEDDGAELPTPLWSGIEVRSGMPVVLADLSAEASRAARRYDRATAVQVEHFGVPQIHDARSPEAGEPYLAWSVEHGRALRSLLNEGEHPNLSRSLEIARSLAEVVTELHRAGHAVGGLTPATVWLGPAGLVQILSLGLHDFDASDLRGAGLRYRSPEQLRAEPASMSERVLALERRERADVWALGMILLELLERRPRLRCREPDELLIEIHETNLVPGPDVHDPSGELRRVLARTLEVDLEGRSVAADEVAEVLDGILTASSAAVARTDPPLPVPRPRAPDPDWRDAVRSLEAKRRAFDQGPDDPLWRLWLLPAVALLALAAVLWFLVSLLPG